MKRIRHKILLLSLFVVIIAGLSILSSPSKQVPLIGEYKSIEYSAIQRISQNIFTKTSWVMGSTLTLEKDSSFRLLNCGKVETGAWKKKEDSLFLFVTDIRYRSDSLQEHGYQGEWLSLPTEPLKYKIEGDEILRVEYSENNGTSKRTNMHLRKTD